MTMVRILIPILCIIFLVVGNSFASREPRAGHDDAHAMHVYTARVIEIVDVTWNEENPFDDTITVIFRAEITGRGSRRGQVVAATQTFIGQLVFQDNAVEIGDRIMLYHDDFNGQFMYSGHVRLHFVVMLGLVFFGLMLLFARAKGLNAMLALGFICAAIFFVMVPAVLAGRNIYVITLIICAYAILSTLPMVIGLNKKAYAAMLGCAGGVALAAILFFTMAHIAQLTGFVDHDATWLTMLDNPIDLRGILFAGVVLGALGAIMDVALSISSSLWEVRQAGEKLGFRRLFASGMTIGQDMMGTMLNTLILAYIGSSLSWIILISAHSTSFTLLFNAELVIVELLRALVGSMGMLFAIPLTAAVCGWWYDR
ncbi:MAG: YibE/F family protein [Defluviitaleaceae bacterium]|nr:YibE/F family protein [Defluviitaleaceae bacterium]